MMTVPCTAALVAMLAASCGSSSSAEPRVRPQSAPYGAPLSAEYRVDARAPGGIWRRVSAHRVKVDLHDPVDAAVAHVEARGRLEIRVTRRAGTVDTARVRPAALGIVPEIGDDRHSVSFVLRRPEDVALEIDGDRRRAVHVFVNRFAPRPAARPGERLVRFRPGMHEIPGDHVLRVGSDTVVQIDGGAVVRGALLVEGSNVTVQGQGIIDQSSHFTRYECPAPITIRGVDIAVRDVTIINACSGGVQVLRSRRVVISHVRNVSSAIWSDGIDTASSSDVLIQDVFLRSSDDSVTAYAWSPKGDHGGTRNLTVRNATLWPDAAHPILVGTHADPRRRDRIERVLFSNIDILEHDEPNPLYQGAMAVNAGDEVSVRDVVFDDVRVERITRGQLFNVRVFRNPDYNRRPGRAVRNVLFDGIRYAGGDEASAVVGGYSAERTVDDVAFEDVWRDGRPVADAAALRLSLQPFATIVVRPPAPVRRIGDADARVRYDGAWRRVRARGYSDESAHLAATRGASARLAFDAPRARVVGAISPGGGYATVQVDRRAPVLVDTYSPVMRRQQLWFDTGKLAPGRHTLTVRVWGRHDRLASGSAVRLDRIDLVG